MNDSAAAASGDTKLKYALAGLAVIGLISALSFFDVQALLRQTLDWIDSLGSAGPLAFIFIYAAATVLFIPGSLLTLGAGVVFGVLWGSVYVSIASTLGAVLAFLIGRYLARKPISKRIEGKKNFAAVDKAVGQEGWKVVLLTRLSPVFPFNLLNYAFGITTVSLRDFFLASWVGMMPGTVMYVYVGSLAGDLATLGTGPDGRQRTAFEWGLYIVGLIATIAVTIYVTKLAKKALEEKTEVDVQHSS